MAAAAPAASAGDDYDDNYRNHPASPGPNEVRKGMMQMQMPMFMHNVIPGQPSSTQAESASRCTYVPDSPTAKASMTRLDKDLARDASKSLALQESLTDHNSHWLVEHLAFKGLIALAVLANAVLMGVEVDHPDWKDEWKRIDHAFGALFFIEMLIKWAALRVSYFRDRWNLLDCVLALMGFMDTWFVTMVGGKNLGLSQFSILRILRLMRLVRLARLFKQFSRLIIVMRTIKDAIETTCWVACVLLLCIYVFAIFCVDFIGHAEEGTYPGYSKDQEVIDQQEVMANFNPHIVFGSMSAAMCSLFNIAILAEWTEIVRPVFLKQPYLVLFFVAFMCFVCFGVMNVIIGMIVDSTIQHARQIERELANSRKREKVHLLAQLKEVIFQVDSSGDAEIDMGELESLLDSEDNRMQSIMDKVSLPYGCSAGEFLALLDSDGDGCLKHDEFIQNLYRVVNCSGFQQMCLLQIGVNKLTYSMNVLAGAVQDISQQVRQQSPPLEKEQTPVCFAPVRPASDGASAAPGRPELEIRPELAISLDAVCQEVSRTMHHKLREELTQTLERFLVVGPKAGGVDGASVVGQWEEIEAKLLKKAVSVPATLEGSDKATSKDGPRVAWDSPLEDIGNVLNVGQPSTAEAHHFHTPTRPESRDGKASYSPRVHGTDAAIGRNPYEIS